MSHRLSALAVVGLGLLMTLGGWLVARRAARAPLALSMALLVDLLLPVGFYLFVVSATARPLAAGVTLFVLGVGFAYADRSKRQVLAEPIVYTDVLQSLDIFRHPQLALPFPNTVGVLAAATAGLAIFVAIFAVEGSAWAWSVWPLAGFTMIGVLLSFAVAGPFRKPCSRMLRRLGPSAEPFEDARRMGPFGLLLVYGIVARGERRTRLSTASVPAAPTNKGPTSPPAGPVVLVQCESFFDIRRLCPSLPRGILPAFDAACQESVCQGRLEVPSWGANTVRTEAAILTGLSADELGLDRFNPYLAMSRHEVPSIASRLRMRGYHTVCIHPFDRRFYGRDRVMPMLGFDEFVASEAFNGLGLHNGYVPDVEVARVAERILAENGPRVFIFIITMENHGPWTDPVIPGTVPDFAVTDIALEDAESLRGYLRGLSGADAMIRRFLDVLQSPNFPTSTLAFYGDHLPSFPKTFAKRGFTAKDTDFFIWRSPVSRREMATRATRVPAHQFASTLFATLDAESISDPMEAQADAAEIGTAMT